MKKYYLIYSAIGLVFALCVLTVILNRNSFIARGAWIIPTGFKTSTAGDVFSIIVVSVVALAMLALIVYGIYKFIKAARNVDFDDTHLRD